MHDLGPAATAVKAVVAAVRDEQLGGPTPCADYDVAALVQHVDGLAAAFADAARKDTADSAPPTVDGALLPEDWRTRTPAQLDDLAEAWRDPAAWTGTTSAGGVEMDGATTGLVATNELVLHGWDLARATGQEYVPDDASIAAARGFVAMFSGPGTAEMRAGLFGPELPAPAGASPFEELLAMAGRDAGWTP